MATAAGSSPAKSTSRGGEVSSGSGNIASQVLGGRVVVVVLVVEVAVVAGDVPSAGSGEGTAVVPVGGAASVDGVPEAAVTDPVPSAGGLSGGSPRSSKKPNQRTATTITAATPATAATPTPRRLPELVSLCIDRCQQGLSRVLNKALGRLEEQWSR